jgi:hypothetical protein
MQFQIARYQDHIKQKARHRRAAPSFAIHSRFSESCRRRSSFRCYRSYPSHLMSPSSHRNRSIPIHDARSMNRYGHRNCLCCRTNVPNGCCRNNRSSCCRSKLCRTCYCRCHWMRPCRSNPSKCRRSSRRHYRLMRRCLPPHFEPWPPTLPLSLLNMPMKEPIYT